MKLNKAITVHFLSLFCCIYFDNIFSLIIKGGDILDETSLLEIGMLNAQHRKIVAASAHTLEVKWPPIVGGSKKQQPGSETPVSVDQWLKDLHLDNYVPTFRKNLYRDPSRLAKLCNDELITLLEIELLGHRRRILAAANRILCSNGSYRGGSGRNSENYGLLQSNSNRFENGVEEDELEDDGSLPLRDPNHLVSGVSSAIKTAWRHSPETLIDGSVTYKAIVSKAILNYCI
jgi:hypothetical protein